MSAPRKYHGAFYTAEIAQYLARKAGVGAHSCDSTRLARAYLKQHKAAVCENARFRRAGDERTVKIKSVISAVERSARLKVELGLNRAGQQIAFRDIRRI